VYKVSESGVKNHVYMEAVRQVFCFLIQKKNKRLDITSWENLPPPNNQVKNFVQFFEKIED